MKSLLLGILISYVIVRVLFSFYKYECNRMWRKKIKTGDACFFISNNKKMNAVVVNDKYNDDDHVIVSHLLLNGNVHYFVIPKEDLYVI